MKKSIQIHYEDWKRLKELCLENNTNLDKYISTLIRGGEYCVYKLYMKNDKTYIGQTKNLKKRLSDHYGNKEILEMEILYISKSKTQTLNAEKKYIIETKNCINKNYILLDFEISEMGLSHSEIIEEIYYKKTGEILFSANNGYTNKSSLVHFLTGKKEFSISSDFIKELATYEKLAEKDIIIKKNGVWYHPTIALDIIISNCDVMEKIEIYKMLYRGMAA